MSCNSVVVDYNNNITTIPNNTCMFSKINSLHCWGDFGLSTYCRRVKRYFKHTVHHCYLEVHFPTIRRKPTLCPCLFFTLNQPGPRCSLSLSLSLSPSLIHTHTHTHVISPHTRSLTWNLYELTCAVCAVTCLHPSPGHRTSLTNITNLITYATHSAVSTSQSHVLPCSRVLLARPEHEHDSDISKTLVMTTIKPNGKRLVSQCFFSCLFDLEG